MGKIRVLSESVVNKIAAGEVVERPASIIKELVENSLDAGAGYVKIEIEDGGKKLIRVTDDGEGVGGEDMALLFQSHATSKLRDENGLFSISTFGFRGEALSSIGAVSRTSIISQGAKIEAEGGRIGKVDPSASAGGTEIMVRDLFYNLPVRRKFLRSADVEYSHIYETLTKFAIANPAVRFDFVNNGRHELSLTPADTKTRIADFFGKELADSLIEAGSDGLKAYLAPPPFAKLSIRSQLIYLNGRFIRDRVITRAINEAYKELIPHGRFPVVFLFLDVAPGEVDVNVHPTKIEVRFRNVWRIHDTILSTLRQKLIAKEITPHISPQEIMARKQEPYKEIVEFFTRNLPGENREPRSESIEHHIVKTGRRYFQLHNLYIVEEVEDGIVIIDQHALHERYLYEELKTRYSKGDITRQRLLIPMVAELSKDEFLLLEENRALIESVGIEFEEFGKNKAVIRTVPYLLANDDAVAIVKDFLEHLVEQGESRGAKKITTIEETLGFMACRAAVKKGKELSERELQELLAARDRIEYSQTCVHGRPTSIKLTLGDLEKFFKRKL